MGLTINTNIAALNAQKNMIKTDNALSASLERLSTGFRINKAADDAASMAIADSLKSQAMGLGQAIRNANDGISVVQTADAALQESINIMNSVKTKSIQAAQDGQTTASRNAIQADIDKLLQELDMIAKTTAFNNQKLLSGNFTNKAFQVGAYSGETLEVSIGSGESNKLGHVTTGQLTIDGQNAGTVELSIYSNLQNQHFLVQSVEVAYDNTAEHSMGALADAINKLSDVLGISANATVDSSTDLSIAAGTTDSNFKINGVTIGALAVKTNDSDGSLVKAINNKTAQHGVYASVDSAGLLTLTSTDDRAIQITATSVTTGQAPGFSGTRTGVDAIFRGADLSTLGTVVLNQTGSSEIIVTDVGGGNVVALTNNLEFDGDVTTTIDSTLASGSVVGDGSTLEAGWTTSQTLSGATFSGNLVTTEASTMTTGSVLGSGSVVASGSVLGGLTTIGTLTGTSGSILTLAIGSTLESGSVIGSGTTLTNNIAISGEALAGTLVVASGSTLVTGSIIGSGTELGGNITISGDTLAGVLVVASGSTLNDGTLIGSGTVLGGNITISGDTLTDDLVLGSGSILEDQSVISSGVTMAGTATIRDNTNASGFTLGSGSVLAAGTILGSGVTLVFSGGITIGGVADDTYTVSGGEGSLFGTQVLTSQSGNFFASGTTLTTGTIVGDNVIQLQSGQDMTVVGTMTLLVDSVLVSGTILAAGSIVGDDEVALQGDNVTTGTTTLLAESDVESGSILAAGSIVGADTIVVRNNNITTGTMTLQAGSDLADLSILAVNSIVGADDIHVRGDQATTAVQILQMGGTVLVSGSILAADSIIGADDITVSLDNTLTESMALATDSTLQQAGTSIVSGSTVGADAVLAIDLTVTGASGMAIESGTILLDASTLANGSTLGGAFTLLNAETVSATGDMYIATGSTLASGSVIAEGTYLTQDIDASGGVTYTAGTVVIEDITTSGDQVLTDAMTLQNGSELAAGSILAATTGNPDAALTDMGDTAMNRLSDLSVLTQGDAQIAIAVAEAALNDLGVVRGGLGSLQNQLTATISNLSTTQVNIFSAESNIRDVDFAEEVANFGKLQILMQAGAFAMAQANASAQVVLTLLG